MVAAAGLLSTVRSITLDVHDTNSIRTAASTLAYSVMTYYQNNASSTPAELIGTFPYPPYFWWESGAAWGAIVDYWAYTGDTSYVPSAQTALLSQVGPNYDFVLANQQFDEGNDDQAFWALAALSALEYSFPALPCPAGTSTNTAAASYCPTSYLTLCINVFNDFVAHWQTDSGTCGGGLDWQYYESNAGAHYKNSVSNGAFFQLAARLARYTGNATYAQWAEKAYDWCTSVNLIDGNYNVYDGTDDTLNCTQVNHIQWSYNSGIFIYGAAVMYNYTNASPDWIVRLTGLLEAAGPIFFGPFSNATNIMYESSCEFASTCATDQDSFKAYLARWMAKSAVLAPYISNFVTDLLSASAMGAVSSCSGVGAQGSVACGTKWYIGAFDGVTGLGQQLAALECVQSLLANQTAPPPAYNISIAAANAPAGTSGPTSISIGTAATTSIVVTSSAVTATSVTSAAVTSTAVTSLAATSIALSSGPASVVTVTSGPAGSAAPSSAAAKSIALHLFSDNIFHILSYQVVLVALLAFSHLSL